MFADTPRSASFADFAEAKAWANAEYVNRTACAEIESSNPTHQTLAKELSLENADALLSEMQRMWYDPIERARIGLMLDLSVLDQPGQAEAYSEYGAYLWEQQHFGEASWAYRNAVLIYSDIGDRHAEGRSLSNLGMALTGAAMLGERPFEEAIAALQKAIQAFRDTKDRHCEGMTLSNLGVSLKEWGKLEEAAAVWQKAAEVLRDTDDGDRLNAVMRMLEEVEQKVTGQVHLAECRYAWSGWRAEVTGNARVSARSAWV